MESFGIVFRGCNIKYTFFQKKNPIRKRFCDNRPGPISSAGSEIAIVVIEISWIFFFFPFATTFPFICLWKSYAKPLDPYALKDFRPVVPFIREIRLHKRFPREYLFVLIDHKSQYAGFKDNCRAKMWNIENRQTAGWHLEAGFTILHQLNLDFFLWIFFATKGKNKLRSISIFCLRRLIFKLNFITS